MKPITIILIIGVIILLLIGIDLIWKEVQKETPGKTPLEFLRPAGISDAEKAKIEAWIIENDLNQYGDPKDIFYLGGTPLFNEKTGRSIDKYEYILKNHPDRPWLK